MKTLYLLLAGVVLGLVVGVAPSLSQDMGGSDDGDAGEEKCGDGDMQEKWMKLQQPGEEHEWMGEEAGEWTVSAKMWMEGIEEPMVMKGSSTITMLHDRYMHEEYTLGEGEMQHQGFGYMAYDNSNKEYQAMYAGDSGTSLHVLTGQRDGNKVELSGSWTEEGMGGMEVTTRVVSERISKDKAMVTVYGTHGDQDETKMMEMTYTRKK